MESRGAIDPFVYLHDYCCVLPDGSEFNEDIAPWYQEYLILMAEKACSEHGRKYNSHEELMNDLVEEFNKYVMEFPFGYNSTCLLEWGEYNGWIIKERFGETNRIAINYSMKKEAYYVAMDGDAPYRIFFSLEEAKNDEAYYIDVFDVNGEHINAFKRLDDGTYTYYF